MSTFIRPFLLLLAAFVACSLTGHPADAQNKPAPKRPVRVQAKSPSIAKALIGKTRAEVAKKIGAGVVVATDGWGNKTIQYEVGGFDSVEIIYSGDPAAPKDVKGRVLSMMVEFKQPLKPSPDYWKEAFRRVGLSTAGVVEGTGEAAGRFKNIPGLPASFFAFVAPKSIVFGHISYIQDSAPEIAAWLRGR